MTDTLVLAIGNTLMGDDAIGQAILEELQGLTFTPEVAFLDGGTQGLYLLPCLEGVRRLLILDATDDPPGTVSFWRQDEVPRRLHAKKLSAHDVFFDEVLALEALMGQLPQELALVGVGMERLTLGAGLSTAVHAAIPAATTQALAALAHWDITARRTTEPCAAASPCR